MDGRRPVGASHHQKVIVIDDALAFVGGLDLTSARLNTPAHSAVQRLRWDADGKAYPPFHDIQAAVDGHAARALGVLCRERWRLAGGPDTVELTPPEMKLWPDCLDVDLSDIPVAIARTVPAYDGTPGVNEIRQLHLDAIAAAQQSLLFENQYFTSGLIAEAISRRLAEPLGPEVLIISPNKQSGWLEEITMGVLRARLHVRLRRPDIHHRYRMMSPQLDEIDNGALNIHSKFFFADDRLRCMGSANLSNRSMACDTECNLCIEAVGDEHERIAQGIARMRARLLAEHLATKAEIVQKVFCDKGLLSATQYLNRKPRRLVELDPLVAPELNALIPQQSLFDPQEPIDPEALIARLVPRESCEPLVRRFMGLVTTTAMLIAVVVTLRYTPLQAYLNLHAMTLLAGELREMAWAPLWIVLAFVLGGLLMVPVTLLIAATGVVFGTFPGAWYALAGSVLSAATGYLLGEMLGKDTVRRLMGPRIRRLSLRIARRGVIAMIIVRALPLAPYSVVNMAADASHKRRRDFLISTALGMLPGIFF